MRDDKNQNRRFQARLKENLNEIMALAPSAHALCDLMVAHLRPNSGNVIELGAGAGKVTESLLTHGFQQNQLALFKINAATCAALRTAFPDCHVLEMPAEKLRSAPLLNVQAVISSLPYTYGIKPLVAKSVCQELKIAITSLGHVGNTLPPARVYAFRKAYV